MIRIAIVDDHAMVRAGLRQFFADQPDFEVVAEAANGREAMDIVRQGGVDVVVLDIGLPGEDGLSVASLLKSRPEVGTIILSARDGLHDRLAGMRAGADRYLVKPVNLLELAMNIDATASRMPPAQHGHAPPPATPPDSPQGHWSLTVSDWVLCGPQGHRLALTTHEFLFVQRLMTTQGQPVAKRELTDLLFGPRAPNANERLNLLVTRLRKKASEALAEPLPVKTLHQIGYAFTAVAHVA